MARLGGDEFVVLVTDSSVDLGALADRILAAVGSPLLLDEREFFLQTSIGIAESAAGTTAELLLQQADAAMYAAKQQDHIRVAGFTPDLLADAHERLGLVNDLRRAIELEQFAVVFQQVIEVSTGDLVGFEALVRWNHPERGLLLPGAFLPVALDTGMIAEIDTQVRRDAMAEASSWPATSPMGAPWIAINVSAKELGPGFAEEVLATMAERGLDPHQLVLELTETDLAQDTASAAEILNELREHGIRIAVDDFGTGYSGLANLRSLPADILKIDRALVTVASERPEDLAVLRSIVDLGHALGLRLVAEGVETEEHLRVLVELGCDLAQGWFYGRERPPEALDELFVAARAAAATAPPVATTLP